MAVLNREKGYLFLSAPHCASRAITQALELHSGSAAVGQHETLAELSRRQPNRFDGLLNFCVIRHPYDWLVTRYHHLTSFHKNGFKEFVRHQTTDNTLDGVIFLHAKDSNRIARYESLEADLNQILRRFGLEIGTLPLVGKTAGKRDFREYYDLEDVQRIREYFNGRDTYGYTL